MLRNEGTATSVRGGLWVGAAKRRLTHPTLVRLETGVDMGATGDVFAVQCPNPQCRKYQLVEGHERGKTVTCLICKSPIRVGGAPPSPPREPAPSQQS